MAGLRLTEQLQKHFGFDSFLNGQEAVIDKVLAGQSAAAIFPTGAGKSLCYQLPAVLQPGLTLVVSPLLSLMKDQLDFLQSRGIAAARLDSTLERDKYNAVLERAKSGGLKILMIAVERFKNERFRTHLQKMDVRLLVVDEAHCVSEWGHNFRPEYLRLADYRKEFNIAQALLLTATATGAVIRDMCVRFGVPEDNVFVTGFYRPNLFLQVSPTPEAEKKQRLLETIRKAPQDPTIVYVTLQKTAEAVAEFLGANHIQAHPYHAGMQSEEREAIQNRFMAGSLDCIVATIAFGMGIDKKDIRRIIHYDLPKSIENYSQEIGRSGRDGKPAFCQVLANRDTVHVLENFVYGDTPDKEAIGQLLRRIKENPGFVWEVKPISLSYDLNIRLLPLKTLLVYLAMEKIIRPKLTYFEQYAFTYNLEAEQIIDRFQGERRQFVAAIMEHCHTAKKWTSADIPAIAGSYPAGRQRIVTALEYFDDKGWIELKAQRSVDVYDILNQAFDLDGLTAKMHALFKKKEKIEIQRIHRMIDFFESKDCISRQLAAYFGEELAKERCGHCSYCTKGPAVLQHTLDLQPLAEFDFDPVAGEFAAAAGEQFSRMNVTRFLCGIYTPLFMKLKVKQLPHFGVLANYPFTAVKKWVADQCR